MERRTVTVDIETIDSATIDGFIETLQRVRAHALFKAYTNVRVEIRRREGPYFDWVDAECVVIGDRFETDEELAKRINAEDAWKARRREEYERLKKEFGDD